MGNLARTGILRSVSKLWFPVSIVQWIFVMPLCKCSLCSLSFYLLNSSKAVQEQIFCFVNYTHSLVPIFFIIIFRLWWKKKTHTQEMRMISWISNMLELLQCDIQVLKSHLWLCPVYPSLGQCQVSAVG